MQWLLRVRMAKDWEGEKCCDIAVAIELSFVVVLPSSILLPVSMDAVDCRVDSLFQSQSSGQLPILSRFFEREDIGFVSIDGTADNMKMPLQEQPKGFFVQIPDSSTRSSSSPTIYSLSAIIPFFHPFVHHLRALKTRIEIPCVHSFAIFLFIAAVFVHPSSIIYHHGLIFGNQPSQQPWRRRCLKRALGSRDFRIRTPWVS